MSPFSAPIIFSILLRYKVSTQPAGRQASSCIKICNDIRACIDKLGWGKMRQWPQILVEVRWSPPLCKGQLLLAHSGSSASSETPAMKCPIKSCQKYSFISLAGLWSEKAPTRCIFLWCTISKFSVTWLYKKRLFFFKLVRLQK